MVHEGLQMGTAWTWDEFGSENGHGIGQGSRRPRVQRKITQLSAGTYDFSNYGTHEDNGNVEDPIMSGLRHEYEDSTWSQEFSPMILSLGSSLVPLAYVHFLQEFPLSYNCSNYFGPVYYCARLSQKQTVMLLNY
jgi:hypothetical protein